MRYVAGLLVALAVVVMAAGAHAQTVTVQGTLSHVDPTTRTLYFTDGRIISLDPAATVKINGRLVTLDALRPGTTVIVTQTPVAPVVAQPAPVSQVTVVSGHPVIDATGTVARFDPVTQTITFNDGRMVRMTNRSLVWQPIQVGSLQPGSQVYVSAVQPVSVNVGTAVPATGQVLMGQVLHVEPGRGLITLRDGRVIRVTPTTRMQTVDRQLTLTELQAGDEIVIRGHGPGAAVQVDATGSALPGQFFPRTVIDAEEVQVLFRLQTP